MISPLDHWKITKRAIEDFGNNGLAMLSLSSLRISIEAAQHRMHLTAFGAFLAGGFVGGLLMLIMLVGLYGR